jgi:hypothetical protein
MQPLHAPVGGAVVGHDDECGVASLVIVVSKSFSA